MAQQPTSKTDKLLPPESPEDQYLDLWEENIRLIAANGPNRKSRSKNG